MPLTSTTPVLSEQLVRPVTMEAQRNAGKTFRNYSEALYATDVKFQPAHRPTGSFSDAKRYFSGKHKLYGFKVEASVAFPDLTLFMNRLDLHRRCLGKRSSEESIVDTGEGISTFSHKWAVLMDKGYEGCDEAVRSIRPKKKP
ncbi:hypothetical protein AeMF1_016432 [Aphanomyces euteiches]|nr:hypothetical protein AeMF1_016432 [Aphanomyces euteiches]KAH9192843.1 hypothetical protein AeNC1_005183 [Aphanomyces euteiches]